MDQDNVTNDTPIKKEWEERFLTAYRECGNLKTAAKKAKVSRMTVWRWEQESSEFAVAVKEAKEEAIDGLEQIAWDRAKTHSDTLLIFLLKSNRPEKYREQQEQKHTGEVKIVVKREKRNLPDAQ